MTSEMTSEEGFSLVEVVVVIAVLGIVMGTAMPLFSSLIEAEKRQETQRELQTLAESLDAHFYDNASFPPTLTDPAFIGDYFLPGVQNKGVMDNWGGNVEFRYTVSSSPDVATVYSRGENGIDDGVANEEYSITVRGAVAGAKRTRLRMRIIAEAIANYLESGGAFSGTWSTDRNAIGLGPIYDGDGFGTTFVWNSNTLTLTSSGADRVQGTSDDLSF